MRAHASTDPPFEPPEHFLPDQRHRHVRLECWRTKARFPDVRAAFEWLSEMLDRAQSGIPPVTEVEYRELEAWYRANEPRLYEVQKTLPSEMLPIGNSRRTCCWHIRFDLRTGPRGEGAGRVAEDIRPLRARYGEGPLPGSGL